MTALEPSAAVVGHLAFITSPPDGRYSPLGAPSASAAAAAAQQANGSQGGWVKALVYALDGWEAAGGGLSVELTGWLPGGAKLFSKTMQPQPAASGGQAQGPLLFAGQGEATVSCVGATGDPTPHCHPPAEHVTIQVGGHGWAPLGAWGTGGEALGHDLCVAPSASPAPHHRPHAGQRARRRRPRQPLSAAARVAAVQPADRLPPALLGGGGDGRAAAAAHHRSGVAGPGLELAGAGAQVGWLGVWRHAYADVGLWPVACRRLPFFSASCACRMPANGSTPAASDLVHVLCPRPLCRLCPLPLPP